jgi:hypothetical protein
MRDAADGVGQQAVERPGPMVWRRAAANTCRDCLRRTWCASTPRSNNLRDTIGTAIQVNLRWSRVEESETTKQLAAWAGIFAVATAFAGIWGMNFEHMPELKWQVRLPDGAVSRRLCAAGLVYELQAGGWAVIGGRGQVSAASSFWLDEGVTSASRASSWLVITKGRAPRMRCVSASITARSAPTCGARSVLLMTNRSLLVMPGPAFARDLLAGGDIDHVDREVRQLGAEGRGQVVAARLDEHDVGVRKLREHAVDGLRG